jgi:BirA family biotin operon repressor/biotin-[acetyl-CoA-carboxylase] ligase
MTPAEDGIQRFETLDGTNAEALRQGARPGTVIVAASQSAGRGRAGRSWDSPTGNLYMTLCAAVPDGRNPAQLSFAAALAVIDALREIAPEGAFALKWPNDVLLSGRKVAGILIEAGDAGYAVGIGVNLLNSPPEGEVRVSATHLAAAIGRTVSPDDLTASICRTFAGWASRWREDGFPGLRAAWLASAHGIGDTIAASTGTDRLTGIFVGVDEDGGLLVDDFDGRRHAIAAGDVVFTGA